MLLFQQENKRGRTILHSNYTVELFHSLLDWEHNLLKAYLVWRDNSSFEQYCVLPKIILKFIQRIIQKISDTTVSSQVPNGDKISQQNIALLPVFCPLVTQKVQINSSQMTASQRPNFYAVKESTILWSILHHFNCTIAFLSVRTKTSLIWILICFFFWPKIIIRCFPLLLNILETCS